MDKYSAVNTLSSFETEGLPSDFFVDESVRHTTESHSEIEPFKIHRKLLRRRHVRKIQKTQERERQQQLEQQQKQKEEEERQLTRERQQRRAEEKGEEEKEKTRAFILRRRHQRSSDEISIISKISNKYDGRKQEEERNIRLMNRYQNKRNNTEAQAQAAAAAYYGDYYCTCTVTGGATTGTTTNNSITYSPSWMIASTPPTKSLTPKLLSTSHSSTLHENTSCMVTRSMDMNYRRISYTLPEFSPVRPSKFRRLQF